MESKIKTCIYCDNEIGIVELLKNGLNPNYEGGFPIRQAARHGACAVVKALIQHGANPHLVGETGASTLQLAVFSGAHWESDKWMFLLPYCDSSQLADGAAVAIIFNNIPALGKILGTGRCNTNIPTTLTGKTVESLAKGYKVEYLLNPPAVVTSQFPADNTPNSPRMSRQSRMTLRGAQSPHAVITGSPCNLSPSAASSHRHRNLSPAVESRPHHRNLSPSVALFFHQTSSQTCLTPPHSAVTRIASPSAIRR